MSTPIIPRAKAGLAAKQATGAGPQQHRSTNRDRTRHQRKRNAVRDQERNAA